MHWRGGGPAVRMPKLLMRATLPNFDEPETLKPRDNLARLSE
jgi:hypothetical protein